MAAPSYSRPQAGAMAQAERFSLLDGLRGLAALAVILDHTPANVLGDLIPGRYLAVDFFFVLSGFVLAHAYGRRLEAGGSVIAFMRARLIRLYPLYLAGCLVGLSVALTSFVAGWQAVAPFELALLALCGVLFLPAPPLSEYGGGHLFPFNGPSWSLFFELAANLVFARLAPRLGWRLLAVLIVAGAIAVGVTVTRHQGVGGPGWLWGHFDAAMARVMFGFFSGVALYRMRAHIRMPRTPVIAPILGLIAMMAAPVPADWRAVYDAAAAIVLTPLLVAFACEAKTGPVAGRVCALLGAVSYGVYVLHAPLLSVLMLGAGAAGADLPALAVVGLTVLVAFLATVLLQPVYEAPARRWLSQYLPGRAAR